MSDDAGGIGVRLAPYVEVFGRFAEAAAVGLVEIGTRYRETFGAYARAVNDASGNTDLNSEYPTEG